MKKSGSLKIKLITVVLLYVMVWIIILLGVYYRMTAKQRLDESSQLFSEKIESMSNQVQNLIEEMDAVSSQVLASQALQKKFIKASASEYDSINYFEYNKNERDGAQDVLWALNSPQKRVDSINVFKNSSYVGLRYSPSPDMIQSISQNSKWEVPEDEKYILIGPHLDEWDVSEKKNVISLVRDYVATSYGFRTVGTIEVQQDYEKIERIFALPTEEELSVIVMDDNGEVIFQNKSYLGEDKDKLLDIGNQESSALSKITLDGISYMEMHTAIPATGWMISLSQPQNIFNRPVREMVKVLILVGSISAVFILLGLMVLISNITKPVLALSEDLKGITELDQHPMLHETTVREVQLLQESFQKLFTTLKNSQDELILAHETELNLKVLGLQSQINPHFLFNSLNAISSAAIEEKSMKVPLMCSQLGELFRYSSGNETKVTLAEELQYMKTYLEFMKWRYEENFQYDVCEEGNGDQIEIAKMTLQPLVENCFTHAFKSIAPPYRLCIVCMVKEDGWIFEVSDNGSGFSQSEIEKISHQIEIIDSIIISKSGYESLQTSNMAILNIYIRLKLQYKGNMYLEILQDEDLKGARVRISINYSRK